MKEIIAKRNKKSYVYLLILTVISILSSVRYLRAQALQFIFVPAMILFSLAALLWIFFIIDPRGVIEKEGDQLILRSGLFKNVVSMKDITEVFLTPHPNKKGEVQKNCISIIATVNGIEKIFVCGDILDTPAVLKTLNDLISNA